MMSLLLLVLDVRAALPLGVIAGIFEFVPNIGPLLAAIPAVLMGFVDSPQKALMVVVLYWGIQFLENNLLIPYLMSEQLDLPPALTLMAQVMMAFSMVPPPGAGGRCVRRKMYQTGAKMATPRYNWDTKRAGMAMSPN